MKKYPLNKVQYYERFKDMIEDIGEKYARAPAISWFTKKQEKKGVTYSQLREDVRNLQARLISLGLAGKHVAIVGENCYEWILISLAVNYCDGVAVFVDTEQSDDSIIQMMQVSDTDAVFCAVAYQDICMRYTKNEKPVFLFSSKNDHVTTVNTLVKEGEIQRAEESTDTVAEETDARKTAAIVFTSGTTSCAKAVMLSQSALLTNASDSMANVKIGSVAFTNLPFYHTYGWTCSVLNSMIVGAELFINGNLRTVFRDLQMSGADTLFTVPLMIEMLHNKLWLLAEQNNETDKIKKVLSFRKFMLSVGVDKSNRKIEGFREKYLGRIKLVICGGAHMETEVIEEFKYFGIKILQGYGITECAPLVSVNRNYANCIGSVGLITAHTEVKIEDGEILVRGKNIMNGYYNAPELSKEVMKDGWFCTGDLGEIDKDGFLFITGRKKNLIVFKSGKKVSPEKLEEILRKIPLVEDVMVYGAESGVSVDDVQIAASIYPNQGKVEGMTNYEILEALQREIDIINDRLPMYQQIRLINIREQEFSKTALKKIKRHLS